MIHTDSLLYDSCASAGVCVCVSCRGNGGKGQVGKLSQLIAAMRNLLLLHSAGLLRARPFLCILLPGSKVNSQRIVEMWELGFVCSAFS